MKSNPFSCSALKNKDRLTRSWQGLCAQYLPLSREGSLWRYSRVPEAEDAKQGWKLHISATLFNVHRTLERIAPLLTERGVQFKAPASLEVLRKINSALETSYSQVGKVITVYPRNDDEAVFLARKLHGLTRRLVAPVVPFDRRYKRHSNVYYRYGAFGGLQLKSSSGEFISAIRDPEGKLQPDLCGPEWQELAWISDPFLRHSRNETHVIRDNQVRNSFVPIRPLSQRGKGGVYQAVDLTVTPPRLCLLKEGRRAGEVSWDRRDGKWRVKHEKQVITMLADRGLNVPRVYSSFESGGNFYLVTEFLDGESLQSFLLKRQRRLRINQVLRYACQLSSFIAQLHTAGWVWRDCKPSNLIVTKDKQLRPLDFEGACRSDKPDKLGWISPAYKHCNRSDNNQSATLDDLYALGSVIYLLLTGRLPDVTEAATPAEKLRRNTPRELSVMLTKLLATEEYPEITAAEVSKDLNKITKALAAAS